MNDLDEAMAECYKRTNAELTSLLRDSQQQTFDKMYKSNLILSVVCLGLCVTVIIVSMLGYLTNKKWVNVFNSYDVMTYEQDGEGINTINAGEGDIINGSESDN